GLKFSRHSASLPPSQLLIRVGRVFRQAASLKPRLCVFRRRVGQLGIVKQLGYVSDHFAPDLLLAIFILNYRRHRHHYFLSWENGYPLPRPTIGDMSSPPIPPETSPPVPTIIGFLQVRLASDPGLERKIYPIARDELLSLPAAMIEIENAEFLHV